MTLHAPGTILLIRCRVLRDLRDPAHGVKSMDPSAPGNASAHPVPPAEEIIVETIPRSGAQDGRNLCLHVAPAHALTLEDVRRALAWKGAQCAT